MDVGALKYETDQRWTLVYLSDGRRWKHIGTIRPVDGGYQYCPKGQKVGGEVCATIAEVKQSLKTDE